MYILRDREVVKYFWDYFVDIYSLKMNMNFVYFDKVKNQWYNYLTWTSLSFNG